MNVNVNNPKKETRYVNWYVRPVKRLKDYI